MGAAGRAAVVRSPSSVRGEPAVRPRRPRLAAPGGAARCSTIAGRRSPARPAPVAGCAWPTARAPSAVSRRPVLAFVVAATILTRTRRGSVTRSEPARRRSAQAQPSAHLGWPVPIAAPPPFAAAPSVSRPKADTDRRPSRRPVTSRSSTTTQGAESVAPRDRGDGLDGWNDVDDGIGCEGNLD